MRHTATVPEVMPVLSPGKHRTPKQGACFMEFASYLAGEKWSDHPSCTHPLLAFLARGVNDFSTDEGRPALVPLIPSVIGVDSPDPRLDVLIALRAAECALPVASEYRQRALATGILSCWRAFITLDGRLDDTIAARIAAAADTAPDAWRWALDFDSRNTHAALSFGRTGRALVSTAVLGIAQACVTDPDDRLRQMLTMAINDSVAFIAWHAARDEAPTIGRPVDDRQRGVDQQRKVPSTAQIR